MARRFAKDSEEEIEEAFFYPSDLVNTKTTTPPRVGEERLGIYPPLFTSPWEDSNIILACIAMYYRACVIVYYVLLCILHARAWI